MEITGSVLDMLLYGRIDRDINMSSIWKAKFRVPVPYEIYVSPSTLPSAGLGVFATAVIIKGTEMGPYPGEFMTTLDVTRSDLSWELFNNNGMVLGFINGTTNPEHWLVHVQCARSEREQNLDIVQVGSKLFYRARKDIDIGEELFVWYGKSYNLYMGIPYCNIRDNSKDIDCKSEDTVDESIKDLAVRGRWRCVLCQRGFNSRSNLRSHMRIHTLEKPFSCKYCSRKFSQSSTLRNHIRLHTGEKPYKCIRCNSSYSQLAGLRAHQRSSTHRPGLHSVCKSEPVVGV